MNHRLAKLGPAWVGLSLLLGAGSQEPGPLQKSLEDLEAKAPWVYNDVAAGFALAKSSQKPLLLVFR